MDLDQRFKSKLISIGTAVPKFKYEQMNLAKWMHQRLDEGDKRLERKFQVLYKKTKIESRYSVLPDFKASLESPVLFNKQLQEPKVEDRLKVYQNEAVNLGLQAVQDCLKSFEKEEITHLITVSCTGMSAPGIELQLKQRLNLKDDVQCHAINFVGCYAAFPAMRMADAFCRADQNAKVLIVAIELCTIHFQNKYTDDHLLSNALFSDGAAAALITADNEIESGMIIKQFAGKLIPKGDQDMAWNIHSEGFLMKLSSYVPDLVDEGIKSLVEQLLAKSHLNPEQIEHWAIHPGGRKILEVCEENLSLKNKELQFSHETLRKYGNMSAPTIFFVLKEMFNSSQLKSGENLFACGFGPGLTLESILFEIS